MIVNPYVPFLLVSIGEGKDVAHISELEESRSLWYLHKDTIVLLLCQIRVGFRRNENVGWRISSVTLPGHEVVGNFGDVKRPFRHKSASSRRQRVITAIGHKSVPKTVHFQILRLCRYIPNERPLKATTHMSTRQIPYNGRDNDETECM